jgi:hypothetical protein
MSERTSSSLVIGASRAALLGVIGDFAAYPQWATGVSAAEVLTRDPDGLPLEVRFTLDAGPINDSYVLRYDWLGEYEVRWELAEKGKMVTQMSGAYRLADAAAPGAELATEVTYELAVGLGVPMIGPLKRLAEKTIINTALDGLRDRVLGLTGTGEVR